MCAFSGPWEGVFGVNYRWTAAISLEDGVGVRGAEVSEGTWSLQSAKQTPSSRLSFDL